ncbi:MAG TPA: hypothetical protein VM029_13225, partial [Opitutaceae bacterium]|nr:hypothetical protein [Opitutaceae bacterium]
MRPKNRSRILAGWCSACLLVAGAKAADVALAKELGDYVAKADGEAERTRTALKLPAGFRAEVWARHPLLADPVAIAFDGKGRLYVAEHHRNRHGTEDDREHRYWLDDDFAARSVEDRLAFMEKWAAAGKKPMRFYTEIPDRLVCIEDRDGDGRAETTRTLALFGDPLDGANVGVLPRDGEVWVTNIPHLWRFRDDGKSEQLQGEKVFSGFGVKFSLHGHDMHGLVIGPDGRLYWSIGDRGFNVRTREGGTVSDLWRGAV